MVDQPVALPPTLPSDNKRGIHRAVDDLPRAAVVSRGLARKITRQCSPVIFTPASVISDFENDENQKTGCAFTLSGANFSAVQSSNLRVPPASIDIHGATGTLLDANPTAAPPFAAKSPNGSAAKRPSSGLSSPLPKRRSINPPKDKIRLGDKDINIYMRRLAEQHAICFCNSFFLLQYGTNKNKWKAEVGNPLESDFVFMPVHDSVIEHWYLLVMYKSPKNDDPHSTDKIVCFLDSLGGSPSLEERHQVVLSKWLEFLGDCQETATVGNTRVKVPQQTNEFDCGVYVLAFAQKFAENAKEFAADNRLDWEVDASEFRKTIQCVLDSYNPSTNGWAPICKKLNFSPDNDKESESTAEPQSIGEKGFLHWKNDVAASTADCLAGALPTAQGILAVGSILLAEKLQRILKDWFNCDGPFVIRHCMWWGSCATESKPIFFQQQAAKDDVDQCLGLHILPRNTTVEYFSESHKTVGPGMHPPDKPGPWFNDSEETLQKYNKSEKASNG